jgi:TRAP-type C4-dicarboxylate transport system permease small subunit
MRLYKPIEDFIDMIFRPLSMAYWKAGGWALAGMMAITAVDVFLRSLFNQPIKGTVDITECLMPVLTTSGLAYVTITKTHINADVLIRRLSQRIQLVFNIITDILSFLFCLLVSWQSFLNMKAMSKLGVTTGVLPIPKYPFVGVVGFGMLLITAMLLKDFLELFRERNK